MGAVGRRLRGAAIDLAPLRASRDFRLLWTGQLVSMLGRQVTVVALPYQVYRLTGSALAVGGLGLVQVVPLLGVSLVGGAVADRVDRRRLLLCTNLLLAAGSGALSVAALTGSPPLLYLYAVAAVIAGVGAVDQPARSALLPSLVDRRLLPSALALNFGIFQVGLIAGPAIAGLVIARLGLGQAYLVDTVSFGAAILAVVMLRPQAPPGGATESTLRSIRTGLGFLRNQRSLLASFVADLDAMIFGMPRALFPVLAATTFGTGPQGLGLLYTAIAVGGVIALAGGRAVTRTPRRGRVVVLSIGVWGLVVVAFGFTTSLTAALPLLAVAGGADTWSAIARTRMMQETTPDHLRGRLSSVYSMVVAGGPYLGDLEAGGVAALTTPAISVVSGGVLCLLGLGVVCGAVPQLWRDDAPAEPPPHPAETVATDAGIG